MKTREDFLLPAMPIILTKNISRKEKTDLLLGLMHDYAIEYATRFTEFLIENSDVNNKGGKTVVTIDFDKLKAIDFANSVNNNEYAQAFSRETVLIDHSGVNKLKPQEWNFTTGTGIIDTYETKYKKCIEVIRRFDPGIIGMYDL